jgi:hypothetical protein
MWPPLLFVTLVAPQRHVSTWAIEPWAISSHFVAPWTATQ